MMSDHFPDIRKMVELGSGSQREVDDLMLTRFACYLIAQNGDPAKPEIAFAQNYFAIQTRRAELIEQRMLEFERLTARKKLTATEKEWLDGHFLDQIYRRSSMRKPAAARTSRSFGAKAIKRFSGERPRR
jgi:hypothetical protein